MAKKSSENVGHTMIQITQDPSNREEELIFNPVTGELEVIRSGERIRDRDAVPATEMAREGFF